MGNEFGQKKRRVVTGLQLGRTPEEVGMVSFRWLGEGIAENAKLGTLMSARKPVGFVARAQSRDIKKVGLGTYMRDQVKVLKRQSVKG